MNREQPPVSRSDGPTLRIRVFGVMGLVVLAGAGTLLLVALLAAPALFYRALTTAGVDPNTELSSRIHQGFATATLVSIAAGVGAAILVAATMSILVARRITRPIIEAAAAAERLAAGDYSARATSSRMGPELATLTSSVNTLAERLEVSEQVRQRLMADLAHELRTPLTSIDATVEAIADGVLPADRETLQTLTDQARRLDRLIDDLNAVSRADEHAFRVSTRPADIPGIVRQAVSQAHARYARHGVTLETSHLAKTTALVDPDRLVEVLEQLLDNSLTSCVNGDVVTVSCSAHPDDVQITVSDTGRGFNPQDAEQIFQRFYRGHPTPGRATGHGIGLTIARALIEAQDGTLTATSTGPGRGASFTITIPRRRALRDTTTAHIAH
jgi:two-component system sensor histidine kinase BaeS